MEEDKNGEQHKQQIAALASAAEQASEIVRRSKEAFDKIKKQLLRELNLDSQSAEHFSNALDAVFGHGHNAGENSQSSLAVNEQLELMERMLKESTERDKKSDERDKKSDEIVAKNEERADETLKLLAKQVEVLEHIASAVWEIAKPG